jgi:hypothetical protein
MAGIGVPGCGCGGAGGRPGIAVRPDYPAERSTVLGPALQADDCLDVAVRCDG